MSNKTKESTNIEMVEVSDNTSIPIESSGNYYYNSADYVNVDVSSISSSIDNEPIISADKLHTLPVEKICQHFQSSSSKGLSSADALVKLKLYGPNVLDPPKNNYFKKLFFYVFGGFNCILWVAVGIFFLCWRPPLSNPPNPTNLALALLVLLVIFLQIVFAIFQDFSTSRIMNSILNMLPSECLVVRDSFVRMIPTKSLVLGDIVHLKLGNKVPADLIILESNDLKTDNSVITGESEPVSLGVKCTDYSMVESKNVCFMGTHVVNGCGMGIVLNTGNNTMMGKISKLTNTGSNKEPLITKEINRFVKIIVLFTIGLALILAIEWVAWLRVSYPSFMSVPSMLGNVMSCVVAFIPEGLPISVALTLLVIAKRMKDNNILPKSLKVVESLGAVNLILSDKTGTLTQNKMFVTTVAFLDSILTPDQCCASLSADDTSPSSCVYQQILLASSLCNNSTIAPPSLQDSKQEPQVNGDATDIAIFKFGQKLTNSLSNDIRTPYVRIYDIPFNSKNKYMLTIHDTANIDIQKKNIFGKSIDSLILHVKGAPDILLSKCSKVISTATNTELELNDSNLRIIKDIQQQLASNGQRVLLLARKFYTPYCDDINSDEYKTEIETKGLSGLTIVGLLGISDPPKPDIVDTVSQCRKSGVRFFMVTGDFNSTATSIARQVGIFSNDESIIPDNVNDILLNGYRSEDYFTMAKETGKPTCLVLNGSELNKLDVNNWDTINKYQEVVFARTTPEHKLLIVKEFQKRDNLVAVTGDGVNDCPALKAADIGIAVVGEHACDVATEAADLVLLGSFSSIVNAIRLGRLVFQNLQKVISYLLPAGSFSEITPLIVNSFFGTPLPLSSFLMIIICCFTDLFLSLSLIMEKEETDLLKLPPRNAKKDHLITLKIYIQSYLFMGVAQSLIALGFFFCYLNEYTGLSFNDLVFTFGNIDFSNASVSSDDFFKLYVPTGNSVLFLTLVYLQIGNLLAIRNRRNSLLSDPIRKKRRNPYIIFSILAAFTVVIIVTEVKWIQTLFGTGSIPVKYWFLPIPFAIIIFTLDEIRKYCVRNFKSSPIAKIAW